MKESYKILIKISNKILMMLEGKDEVNSIQKLMNQIDNTTLNMPFFNLKRDQTIQEKLTLLQIVEIFNNDISEQIQKETNSTRLEDISIIKVHIDLVRDKLILDPGSCLVENNMMTPGKLSRLMKNVSLRKGGYTRRLTRMRRLHKKKI
jgi:hypothetical protein